MQVILYSNNEDPRKINKTLTNGLTINCLTKIEDVLDYDKPILSFAKNAALRQYNYAHIPDLNTYYFIDHFDDSVGGLTTIYFDIDDLKTDAAAILSSRAHIVRSATGNKYLVDNLCMQTNKSVWEHHEVGEFAVMGNYYIIVKGGP